jgi:hypothetical protein
MYITVTRSEMCLDLRKNMWITAHKDTFTILHQDMPITAHQDTPITTHQDTLANAMWSMPPLPSWLRRESTARTT